MTPRSASVLPDAYTSGLSPVMLRMEPYTYPHFSRRRLRGCWLSIYRQRMESFGHNTFFTLEQAREEAARRHLECRQVLSRIRSRSSVPLYVSHGTALELHGMIATMNYLPGYGSELVHVSVCRQRDLRKIQGMKFHYARHGVDVAHADELVSSVSAMQAVCQIAPYVDERSLVIAMDWLTCANPDLRVCTHDELSDYIRSAPRFIGSAKCRKALRLSKPGTDSPQETVLRLESDAYGLPETHVNYEIIDHIRGSGTMKVDIAYPDDRVCIEYDGNYHYTHGRWMYDLDKRNRLRDLGFTPFVATREHLASKQKLNELFGMVARAIASHRYGLD